MADRSFPVALGLLLLFAVPAWAGEVCVRNLDRETLLFVAEARGGDRTVGQLATGEVLCATGQDDVGGVVSVFESSKELEGCSRLVPAPGGTRTLRRYVSFDRCAWDDNTK